MLDINIYNTIYNWTRDKLAHSFKQNETNVDICREIMPPNKTQAIVITKNSFGNIEETYIDGTGIANCEMSLVAVQKLGSYTENELLTIINGLEQAFSELIKHFDSNDKPKLKAGYFVKDIQMINSGALKQFDINTILYSIDVLFKIACPNNL